MARASQTCEHCGKKPPLHGRFCPKSKRRQQVRVQCPECGPVTLFADFFHNSLPASGLCSKCGCRLYFDENPAEQLLPLVPA